MVNVKTLVSFPIILGLSLSALASTPNLASIANDPEYVTELQKVSQSYTNLITSISDSKNANEFDEHFHELKSFISLPGTNQYSNIALCAHLKSIPVAELQYVETLIDSPDTGISLASCQQDLLFKLSLAAGRKKSAELDDSISKIRPIPFEEREVPDINYVSLQGLAKKEVMLSFDDGPTLRATVSILQALKKAGVKAAFFSTGRQAQSNKDLVKKVLNDGHVVGSHSFYHTLMMGRQVNRGLMTYDYFLSEFIGGHMGVYLAAGYIDPYFRFPNGCMNKNMRTNVNQLGLKIFGWNVDSFDWQYQVSKYPNAQQRSNLILQSFVKNLNEGGNRGVILMHDIFSQSAEALPLVLNYLSDNGYKVVLLKPKNRNFLSTNLPVVTQASEFMQSHNIKLSDIRPQVNVQGDPIDQMDYHPSFRFEDMFPQLTYKDSPVDPLTKSCE